MDDAARNTESAARREAGPGSAGGGAEIRPFEPKTSPRGGAVAKEGPDAKADIPAPAAPAAKRRPRRDRTRRLLFSLMPIALIAGGYTYVTGGQVMTTDNAYVQADILGISTDVAGVVGEIDVRDNQEVKAGDVLFRLDDRPFRFALERADAQLGVVGNDLEALKASYKGMQGQIEQGHTDIAFYETAFKRQQDLATKSVASQATFDQARHDLDGARLKLAQLESQLSGIAASLNGKPDAPVAEHPRYRDAVAARAEAERQLDHTTVRAPMNGIVTNVPSLQKGQYLEAATSAFSLVSTGHAWIQANPKETELTWVKPGQTARIHVDTYPGVVWTGTVDSISPASAASFSLLPAQNTSGNWVKVVQRIAMRVKIDTPAEGPQLRSGMSVTLEIDTGHARGLPSFVTDILGTSKAGNG
ncbi:HlyD family secretion protein [Bosea sp. (in: a-proteobacteria)]|uniref:HlyD family secretion protein n=1 Tax=Bosea sp. (in: a-proteobacteria) TaxID=1871050 RepID=UPI0026047E5E|nr:HlyD family secretion protein [Bosea sp. (in: a-proteobacteria)]MCO5090839.1 HlyD family secretion protein [Bosea sp. (in: a-proteobacteria)]